MKCLRQTGVPFGISVTAAPHDAERILSEWFKEHGTACGWIFQSMPIGRDASLELLMSPKQRLWR